MSTIHNPGLNVFSSLNCRNLSTVVQEQSLFVGLKANGIILFFPFHYYCSECQYILVKAVHICTFQSTPIY